MLKLVEIEALNADKGEVTFYTLLPVDEHHQPTGEPSAFEDFLDFMYQQTDSTIQDEFKAIRMLIKDDLAIRGAQNHFFRDEADRAMPMSRESAKAFPQHRAFKNDYPSLEFNEEEQNCRVRLYCLRVNRHILILLSGAIKSPYVRAAQDCPQVKPYFDFCNQVAIAFDECIQERQIAVIDDEEGYPILAIQPNTSIPLCLPSRNS